MKTMKTTDKKGWLAQAKTGIKSLGLALAAAFAIQTATAEPITSQDAFETAVSVAASGATITVGAGEFDLQKINVKDGRSLTFVGASKDNTVFRYGLTEKAGEGSCCYSFDGAGAIAFKNCTLSDWVSTKDYYRGFVRAASMSFENCKITNVAGCWGSGAVTFTQCEFVTTVADSFNMKCYSGTSFTFDTCTFSSPYGFIDAYRQNSLLTSLPIYVKDCTFVGTGASPVSKPAVRLCDYSYNFDPNTGVINDNSEGGAWDVYFSGNTTATNIKVDSTTESNLYGCRFYSGNEPYLAAVYVNGDKVWEKGEKIAVQPKNFYVDSTNPNLWHIANVDGLKEFRDSANGGTSYNGKTIQLDADIDLADAEWTPINATYMTFDGQDHTVKNFQAIGEKNVGFFGAPSCSLIKNLKIENATVTGINHVAALAGDGLCLKIENCQVKNSTITASVKDNDDGDKAGAICGYLSGEPNAWVKNCTVTGCTVKGYRDVGGAVGYANGTSEVSGTAVSTTTVVNDRSVNYKNYKTNAEFDIHEIVGEAVSSATVSGNTPTEVVIEGLTYVAQIGETKYESLAAAVAAAQTGDTIVMTDDTTLTEAVKITKSVTIDTNGKAITAPDTVNGSAVNFHGALVASGEDVLVTIKGTGSISASLGAGKSGVLSAICAADGATLELDGVNIHGIAASSDNITIYAYEDGLINIRGGNYLATGGGTCVSAYGSEYAEVNIYGGNFDAKGDRGPGCAWAAKDGVVNIYGGTFHADPLTNKKYDLEVLNAVYCLYDYSDCAGTSFADYMAKLTVYGGTFKGFNPKGDNIGMDVDFVAEGYTVVQLGDAVWTIALPIKKDDGTTSVPALEQQSTSSVDEQKLEKVVTNEAAKTAIKQETVVEGVKLTTTPKKSGDTVIAPAGMQAVVDAAKAKNPELATALEAENASMVTVKVDVAVSPVVFTGKTDEPQNVAEFKLTPKATVTVVNTTEVGTTSKSETVKVTNDMIDQTAGIAVTIVTGFQPEMIVHKDENGKVIETFTGDQIVWNDEKKTATVMITHFSTLEAVKVSYAAQAGDALYGTLAAAFAAVPDETPTMVKVLKDLTLTEGVTFASGKAATLDFAGRTISDGTITSAGALTLTGGTMNSALDCTGSGTMAITGGEYTAVLPAAADSAATNAGPFFVSGGTFVSEIPWAYCAPGYEPQAKGEGKYGVKDANIFIRDIKAAQRYPWNGYVDITLDVCWSTKATARLFIEAYEEEGTAKPLSMESATMLDADGSEIEGTCAGGYVINAPTKKTIHLMWNSDADGAVHSRVAEGVHFKFIAK